MSPDSFKVYFSLCQFPPRPSLTCYDKDLPGLPEDWRAKKMKKQQNNRID